MHYKSIVGLTLVEFLCALSLGLLLLQLLIQLSLMIQQNHNAQWTWSAIEDKAITAITLVNKDIKLAGNIGCAKLTPDFPVYAPPGIEFTIQNSLLGQQANPSSSDSITLRYADFNGAVLSDTMENLSTLLIQSDTTMKKEDVVLISDCQSAEIFIVAQISKMDRGVRVTTLSPLHKLYEKHAEISHFVTHHYFVAPTIRQDKSGYPIYALYKKALQQPVVELVSGVAVFNIHYTVLQAERVIQLNAEEVSDWRHVIGVEIEWEIREDKFHRTWFSYAALPQRAI
jgi:hypothetical protein